MYKYSNLFPFFPLPLTFTMTMSTLEYIANQHEVENDCIHGSIQAMSRIHGNKTGPQHAYY